MRSRGVRSTSIERHLEIGRNVRHGVCHCWRVCRVERADRYKTAAVSFTLGSDGDAHEALWTHHIANAVVGAKK